MTNKRREKLRQMQQRLETSDEFSGYRVDDQPYVTDEDCEGIDEMLDELGRRVHKNGRLDEYKDSLRHTKPSEQRRNERQAQAHRAKNDKDRRQWRGGVRD